MIPEIASVVNVIYAYNFFQVFIMMLLFYGSQHIKMSTSDYTSTLAFIGILTGAHIFCFLIIYQFRKNLVEERNIRRNTRNGGRNSSTNIQQQTNFVPSAPYNSGKYSTEDYFASIA